MMNLCYRPKVEIFSFLKVLFVNLQSKIGIDQREKTSHIYINSLHVSHNIHNHNSEYNPCQQTMSNC